MKGGTACQNDTWDLGKSINYASSNSLVEKTNYQVSFLSQEQQPSLNMGKIFFWLDNKTISWFTAAHHGTQGKISTYERPLNHVLCCLFTSEPKRGFHFLTFSHSWPYSYYFFCVHSLHVCSCQSYGRGIICFTDGTQICRPLVKCT